MSKTPADLTSRDGECRPVGPNRGPLRPPGSRRPRFWGRSAPFWMTMDGSGAVLEEEGGGDEGLPVGCGCIKKNQSHQTRAFVILGVGAPCMARSKGFYGFQAFRPKANFRPDVDHCCTPKKEILRDSMRWKHWNHFAAGKSNTLLSSGLHRSLKEASGPHRPPFCCYPRSETPRYLVPPNAPFPKPAELPYWASLAPTLYPPTLVPNLPLGAYPYPPCHLPSTLGT